MLRITAKQLDALGTLSHIFLADWYLDIVYDSQLEEWILIASAQTKPQESNYVIGPEGQIGYYSQAARNYLGLPDVR